MYLVMLPHPPHLSSPLVLGAGDLVALLTFAAAGRINHGGVIDVETLFTALPFIASRCRYFCSKEHHIIIMGAWLGCTMSC